MKTGSRFLTNAFVLVVAGSTLSLAVLIASNVTLIIGARPSKSAEAILGGDNNGNEVACSQIIGTLRGRQASGSQGQGHVQEHGEVHFGDKGADGLG